MRSKRRRRELCCSFALSVSQDAIIGLFEAWEVWNVHGMGSLECCSSSVGQSPFFSPARGVERECQAVASGQNSFEIVWTAFVCATSTQRSASDVASANWSDWCTKCAFNGWKQKVFDKSIAFLKSSVCVTWNRLHLLSSDGWQDLGRLWRIWWKREKAKWRSFKNKSIEKYHRYYIVETGICWQVLFFFIENIFLKFNI